MHLPLAPFSFARKSGTPPGSSRLVPLDRFGSNPGQLHAWAYVPELAGSREALPLVVVLHGCTQTAAGYDRGSGWSELAAAYGFAVLFPEQRRANNANLCFNWFEPGDTRRGAGEAQSIAQMIETMIERDGVDPGRIFVTGLSAGGAMTSVMLAIYPELFAGGAILAGLPHGAAASVAEAFQQMRSPSPNRRTSGSSIKQASRHAGPWPAVSIWHGTADSVVSPSNADAIARQWREVHRLSDLAAEEDRVDGYPHRVWRDAQGQVLVEEYRVTGMGHGTPLATTGECGCGEAGAFMLEVGISSTIHSAKTWGLLNERCPAVERSASAPREVETAAAAKTRGADARPQGTDRIAQVIEDALRKAGLMK